MQRLPWNPTVAQLRLFLSDHGVTAPSRLRKDDLIDLANLCQYGITEHVTSRCSNLGATVDVAQLRATWSVTRPGFNVDGTPVNDSCCAVHPIALHDDCSPIRCDLAVNHDGDHEDHSHVTTQATVIAWENN